MLGPGALLRAARGPRPRTHFNYTGTGDPMRHASTATTRTMPRGPARYEPVRRLLEHDQVLTSPESRLEYHIGECVGEGGFGQVYLAQRRGLSRKDEGVVCVKVSERMDGWLREAYFGQLLDGHPRAIRVYEAF